MCQVACWGAAALIGLLIFLGTTGAVGFIGALMAGAAMTVFSGLVVTRLFCSAGTTSQTGVNKGSSENEPVGKKGADSVVATAKTAPEKAAGGDETASVDATGVTPEAETENTQDHDGDGGEYGQDEGTRPTPLSGPRDGKADDLKQIKGVGPKLEKMLTEMGVYHFDQIAGWSADEVAWVDANLKGFRGRATRDKWIEQATTLAAGGETEFSKRVEDGDVY